MATKINEDITIDNITEDIQNIQIYNFEDKKVNFKEAYEKNDYTMIIFVRHFLCFFCRDNILALQNSQKDLEKSNVKLYVFGSGSTVGGKKFADDAQFPSQNVYADPERNLYKKLGLKVAPSLPSLHNRNSKRKTKTGKCSGCLWFLSKRVERGHQGEMKQLGGTFVLDKNGKVLFQYRASYANDDFDHQKFIQNDLQGIIENEKQNQQQQKQKQVSQGVLADDLDTQKVEVKSNE